MTIGDIIQLCEAGALQWSNHIMVRLLQRNITMDDVINALTHGEIIEQYPNDYPFPSCLVLGINLAGNFLHVVCGIGENLLWLVTAYFPNPDEWSDGFKVRKEQIT
jgi:hypothetical protein